MFNPSRLRLARKRRGLTKIALANKAGITVRSISAFEAGTFAPSDESLQDLARILVFPTDFFHAADPEEPDARGASFRGFSTMTAGQRDMALAAGSLAIELSRWIDQRFELPPTSVPNLHALDPESAAQALRAEWLLGERSIPNVLHLLEAKGVRIFSIPRESDSISAFSFWSAERPFIFLTTDTSGERGRYDCAHEIGHLVLHRQSGALPRSRQVEAEADRFASAFLMPRSSVLANAPRHPSLSRLIEIKKKWLVSLAALVHRLRSVGLLTEWEYRTLWIDISTRGFRATEPSGIPRETSQVLAKVFSALRQEGVPRSTVAKDLCITMADLDALIFMLTVSGIRGGSPRSQKSNSGTSSRNNLRLLTS
jgi:Predicted Zn peptidase